MPGYELTPLGVELATAREEAAKLRKQVELLTAERDGARKERNHYMAELRTPPVEMRQLIPPNEG